MTAKDMINLAFSAYPEVIDTAGDPVALFIEQELMDSFDTGHTEVMQLAIAAQTLRRGIDALSNALYPVSQRFIAMTSGRNPP
jgi:hypothetical protein